MQTRVIGISKKNLGIIWERDLEGKWKSKNNNRIFSDSCILKGLEKKAVVFLD